MSDKMPGGRFPVPRRILMGLGLFLLPAMTAMSSARAAIQTVDDDTIGIPTYYTVREEDNLYALARRFDAGIMALQAANPGVDPWLPQAGTRLLLPTMHVLPPIRRGIVLNLPERRLFYFAPDHTVMDFPVGIGREGWQTPVGETSVVAKHPHPAWYPPASIRATEPGLPAVIPAGPDNPMGDYALFLGWQDYAIHGTNHPNGVGMRVSHGCIRLYPEDIAMLFQAVRVGTPVAVINAPFLLGWRGDTLFLEVEPGAPREMPQLQREVVEEAGMGAAIDWRAVEWAAAHRNGIPVAIATRIPSPLP